ncbi:unnamed protein product [Notodromas monacha]|uniref:CDGSH iron-sulfur domain-containing protein 2 homologue n=1 Tax=Notodromas monacha TaxID=399045 RepID=A0A7R9BP25_9CRUS|nr:unnamed protein product [Notodromas monacha]CAG0918753.1 unnamed protein product [Notodromas monacha]
MKLVKVVVQDVIGSYLVNLPIPDSIGGWFHLSLKDWASLVPLAGAMAGLGWLVHTSMRVAAPGLIKFCPLGTTAHDHTKVNLTIDKGNSKRVDTQDIEDIGDKKVFCRCWRSKNFPYCDGAHNKHNEETGDNVGPLIISKKAN